MSRIARCRGPVAVAGAVVLALLTTPASAATTVAGRLADGTIPSSTKGVALVRAFSPATTQLLAGAHVRRTGTYALRVKPGVIGVLADVVRLDRKATSAITPLVRARSGRRVSLRVSLKRRRPVRPKRRVTSRAARAIAVAAADAPIIAVKWFAGSGPYANLGRGLADMVVTDLVDRGEKRCGTTVVEWNHRDLVQQELDLQQKYKEYFDPATLVRKRWLEPTVFIEGKVTTTDDRVSWSLQLVDAKSGEVLGGDSRSVATADVFDAEGTLVDRLLDQLCPRTYEVTLDVATTAGFPSSHTAQGTIHSVLTATGTATSGITGSASAVYESVTYVSTNPLCTFAPENARSASWKVDITGDPAGSLNVTWTPGDAYATAVVTCNQDGYVSTAGGQPGPLLTGPTPTTFTVPAAGASQAIGGGLAIGNGGWTHTGTISVKKVATASR